MTSLAVRKEKPVIRIGISALMEAEDDYPERVEYLDNELRNGHRLEIYSGGVGPQACMCAAFESADDFRDWLQGHRALPSSGRESAEAAAQPDRRGDGETNGVSMLCDLIDLCARSAAWYEDAAARCDGAVADLLFMLGLHRRTTVSELSAHPDAATGSAGADAGRNGAVAMPPLPKDAAAEGDQMRLLLAAVCVEEATAALADRIPQGQLREEALARLRRLRDEADTTRNLLVRISRSL
jgi:hypothetical protein